jgi:hypothetical protein
MPQVLREGVIYPGIRRINPEALQTLCFSGDSEEGMPALYDQFIGDYGGDGPQKIAWDALVGLVEDSVERVKSIQRSEGWVPSQARTQFMCLDLLAGDLGRVFFSIWNWAWWVPKGDETGFVFDAEDLIRRGACVRPHDLLKRYTMDVIDQLARKFMSRERAARGIMQAIRKAQRDGQWCGDEATEFLHGKDSGSAEDKAMVSGSRAELVFTGPVKLEWAIDLMQRPPGVRYA